MAEPLDDAAASPALDHADLVRVVAALAFAADEPVAPDEIADAYAAVTGVPAEPSDVEAAVERYNADADEHRGPFRIERWGGGFRVATTPDLAPYVRAHHRDERRLRLSRSLLETLAILAYRQPATKPEVDFVRGVDAGYALTKLLDLGLVDVVGRSDSLGRPLLYGTTPRFLEAFGLADLEALPRLREIEDLLDDPHFNRERARLLALEGLLPEGNGEASHAASEDAGGEELPTPRRVDSADDPDPDHG